MGLLMPWWLLLLLLVSFGSPAHRFSVRISQLESVQLLCSMLVSCHFQSCRGRCTSTKDLGLQEQSKELPVAKGRLPFWS